MALSHWNYTANHVHESLTIWLLWRIYPTDKRPKYKRNSLPNLLNTGYLEKTSSCRLFRLLPPKSFQFIHIFNAKVILFATAILNNRIAKSLFPIKFWLSDKLLFNWKSNTNKYLTKNGYWFKLVEYYGC